jgi:hypothetical protein
MYRYISRESCSQFDSLPLTSLTIPLCPRSRAQVRRLRALSERRAASRQRASCLVGLDRSCPTRPVLSCPTRSDSNLAILFLSLHYSFAHVFFCLHRAAPQAKLTSAMVICTLCFALHFVMSLLAIIENPTDNLWLTQVRRVQ